MGAQIWRSLLRLTTERLAMLTVHGDQLTLPPPTEDGNLWRTFALRLLVLLQREYQRQQADPSPGSTRYTNRHENEAAALIGAGFAAADQQLKSSMANVRVSELAALRKQHKRARCEVLLTAITLCGKN